MLEQESLMHGQNVAKLPGARTNGTSEQKNSEKYTIDSLLKKLNEFLTILKSHGVDPEIVNQIFKQVFLHKFFLNLFQTNINSYFNFQYYILSCFISLAQIRSII